MSTSKCRSSFLSALSVTILERWRTAPKLRRYPAGSSWGSGGLGMSILGLSPGEKGVMGVGGPLEPEVPPDVRFMMRELESPRGDLMLDSPDAREDMDLEVESDGLDLVSTTGFGAFSRRENSPMLFVTRCALSMARRWA